MSNSIFIVLLAVAICCVPVLATVDQIKTGEKLVNNGGAADVGTFLGFPSSLTSTTVDYYSKAEYNKAVSGGAGGGSSGNRLFFGGTASITDTNFNVEEGTRSNEAKSRGDNAVSGSLFVFNNIDNNSKVSKTSVAYQNTATVRGGVPPTNANPMAISGSQTQVGSLDQSEFTNGVFAIENTANNKISGDSVSGVENAFGSVSDSYVALTSIAASNSATTKDGVATSGTENGINAVTDSTLVLQNYALGNTAKSNGGNAIAGVQDSINSVVGSFPAGGAVIDINSKASENAAYSKNGGSSVAGIVTNIGSAERANIGVTANSYDNTAQAEGTSAKSYDAVSGTTTTASDIESSTLTVDTTSSGNVALNTRSSSQDPLDNDAVAGSQLVVGNSKDSNIFAKANSNNNKAVAINGDAVAGNQIQIGYADADSNVVLDLTAENNEALSINGDAVVDNDVTIGGSANVIGYP